MPSYTRVRKCLSQIMIVSNIVTQASLKIGVEGGLFYIGRLKEFTRQIPTWGTSYEDREPFY